MQEMKAVFLYTDRPKHMETENVSKPDCKAEDVLIRVTACAVCGTDGRMYEGTKDTTKGFVPQIRGYGEGKFIIGHEIVGIIEEIGSKVKNPEYEVGCKVILVTSIGCQKKECRPCREGNYNMCANNRPIGYYYPGGFAEYILVQDHAVKQSVIIPVTTEEHILDEHLAMVEPLSCAINGQNYLNIKKGEYVAIVGAGPIGLMHGLLAKAKGAKVILAEYSSERLIKAKEFGFDYYIATKDTDLILNISEITKGEGIDVGIVACSVSKVAEDLLGAMAMKGRLSFFAGFPKQNSVLKLDGNIIHYKEVSIYGAFASNKAQFEEALELIASRKILMDKIVTHTFPLENTVEAMEKMLDKKGNALKVVIKP
ncbi:alcohol dehydrogenase catalytic domain-containing protein [bacterium]|nr:alcohol dehydrogenase catalytic domain-containing protein [bacterium]